MRVFCNKAQKLKKIWIEGANAVDNDEDSKRWAVQQELNL